MNVDPMYSGASHHRSQMMRPMKQVTLAPDPMAPGFARHFIYEVLNEWECESLLETAQLLVSELVTNAVLHAGSPIEVTVTLDREGVRVDVIDHTIRPVMPRNAPLGALSGRGLRIVDALAKSWGTRPLPEGKSVWFTLPVTTPLLQQSEPV